MTFEGCILYMNFILFKLRIKIMQYLMKFNINSKITCLIGKIALFQEMKSPSVADDLNNNREVLSRQAPLNDCPGALSGGGWVPLIGGPSDVYH